MIYNHNSKFGGKTYQKNSIYVYLIQFFCIKINIFGYVCTENFTSY